MVGNFPPSHAQDETTLTEHHILPILRYRTDSAGSHTIAEAGTAFTFGEGTVVTCWHCVARPAGPDEAYGVAVRRDDISAPYEFCSIDDLGRDENGADLALGRIDWTPGQALTLATESAAWGERVETYGYPFSIVVPDQTFSDYKSVTFSPVFLRGYVTQVVPNLKARPAMHLDMLSPPGLSGAPIIREDGRDVLGVLVGDRNIQLGGESFRFGEALLLDALRSARSTATDHRPLAEHLER
jgi:Trypsin-like peptidase domain